MFSDLFSVIYGDCVYSRRDRKLRKVDAGWELSLELPGVKKVDLSVDKEGILLVKTERGPCSFRLDIYDEINWEKASALLEFGILTVSLPSVEKAAQQIPVTIR